MWQFCFSSGSYTLVAENPQVGETIFLEDVQVLVTILQVNTSNLCVSECLSEGVEPDYTI